MNNKRISIIIIIIVIGILGVLIYRYISERNPKYKWSETYEYKSKEPYGTKLLFQLLKKERNIKVLKKSLVRQLPLKETNANYLFIGNFYTNDTADIDHLLSFVEKGNKAFLFTKSLPDFLIKKITDFNIVYDYYDTTNVNVYFSKNDTVGYNFNHRILKEDAGYRWNCVDYDYFTDTLSLLENYKALSTVGDHICYFTVKYGKGELYFHTIPLLFTNYHLSYEKGFKNAEKCFKYFDKGNIYWDEKKQFLSDPALFDSPDSSPLRYILSQKSFKWSWYIGLSLVLLFLLFRSKREQRIIPIINKSKNTSLEFNKAISVLYYQANDNAIVAEEIMKMFILFLKNKYNINVALSNYETYIPIISQRSEIKENIVTDIFKNHIAVVYGDKTNKDILVNFHRSIEYFYKNSK